MTTLARNIIGPRIPRSDFGRHWLRYLIPLVLLLAAATLLLVSSSRPYWHMKLRAPQYPKGLHTIAYLTHLSGDIREINNLNHYIGMLPLEQGGQIERSTAMATLIIISALLLLAWFVHSRWAVLLALPAILFPVMFLVDLQAWLWYFGNHLDRKAALSSSIKPFTPRVLGVGLVGQFKTVAVAEQGFWLAVIAAGIAVLALYFHRRAYKPLADLRRKPATVGQSPAGSRREFSKREAAHA